MIYLPGSLFSVQFKSERWPQLQVRFLLGSIARLEIDILESRTLKLGLGRGERQPSAGHISFHDFFLT